MVRAGSTLQYNLAKSILGVAGKYTDIGFVDSKECMLNKVEEIKTQCVLIGKAHSFYSTSEDSDNVLTKRLYIYRDLRDVAASLRKKLNLNEIELIDTLDEAVKQYNSLKEKEGVLFQKYESLFFDMNSGIYEIASFLECSINDSNVDIIFDENKIDSVEKDMKKVKSSFSNKIKIMLHNIGFKRFQVFDDNLIHHNHISKTKGKNGSWRGVLEPSEIEVIESRYAVYMRENGYVT